MKPAYRPGLVSQFAIKPRMGARSRGQTLTGLLGDCPSLLDGLSFYPTWVGSQCVDLVSGAVLTNSANPVIPSDISPNGETAGKYVSASSNYLDASFLYRDLSKISYTVAAWSKHSDISTSRAVFFGSKTSFQTFGIFWRLANTGIVFTIGDGVSYFLNSNPATINTNSWVCSIGYQDASRSVIGLDVNNIKTVPVTFSPYSTATGGAVSIGRLGQYNGAYMAGSIGQIAMWMRLLSDQEKQLFYNNGIGQQYPFR